MSNNYQNWADVDAYAESKLMPAHGDLGRVIDANAVAGLPEIDVSPTQGAMLNVMASAIGAEHILEIGTLGGYSTIHMARALPEGGQLVSLEYQSHHAKIARQNADRAGLGGKIEIIEGAAADSLPELAARNATPFDMVFIDADKPNNALYLDWALKLTRKGAVIICDNVIREGDVIDAQNADPNVEGARAAFDFIAQRPDIKASAIQTVGTKGHDGLIILTNPG